MVICIICITLFIAITMFSGTNNILQNTVNPGHHCCGSEQCYVSLIVCSILENIHGMIGQASFGTI